MMSNSTCLNGGATLFLTTLTRVWLPTGSSLSLICPMRRMFEPRGGVELERVAARRRLRIAEHDADLHADLIDEDHHAARLRNGRRQLRRAWLMRRGLQAGQAIAHLAFEFALGVRAATESTTSTSTAPERTSVSAISACSPVSGCGNQEIFDLDPELCAHKRDRAHVPHPRSANAALFLRLGNDRAA